MNIDSGIRISVIIPTHNSEKFVEECVQSVMNQTHKNLQIICVDSSNDNTLEILKSLQQIDNRIEIIEDANGSYGHKLNVGIKKATGKYIAIVESDDYILPETYEVLLSDVDEDVDYIKSSGTNNFADVKGKRIFFPEINEDAEKNLNRVIDLVTERDKAFISLPRIWTALYRREFLIENGIWANETPGASFQDTSFTLLVAVLAKTCIYKKGAFYCYRNDNAGSSVKSKSKVFYVCEEYKYLESILNKKNKYTDEIRNTILRRKLYTYLWNVQRLEEQVAQEFRVGIAQEVAVYIPEMLEEFSDAEKNVYEILTKEETLKEYLEQQERAFHPWDELLQSIINAEKEYVIVGAGAIGEKVLWLQQLIGKKFIVAVGDNNYLQITDKKEGYHVESVESLVQRYPNTDFIVANRKHRKEIEKQLLSLGIDKNRVVCLDSLSKIQLFGEYIKRYS